MVCSTVVVFNICIGACVCRNNVKNDATVDDIGHYLFTEICVRLFVDSCYDDK